VPAIQSLIWTGDLAGFVIGSVASDRFVTWSGGSGDLTLWRVGSPPTALDSATLAVTPSAFVGRRENDSGLAGFIYADAAGVNPRRLVSCVDSGGALTIVDTLLGSGSWSLLGAAGDGSGFMVANTTTRYFITTAGSTSWSHATADTFVGCPRANRYVTQASTTVSLRDSSGSVLDTDTAPGAFSGLFVSWVLSGPDRMTYLSYDDTTGLITYRTLDTAGDVLSWVAATATFDPGYGTGDATVYPRYASWDGQIAIAKGYAAP